MAFSAPLRNRFLFGQEINRTMYSMVNQMIQMSSMVANFGLSPFFPFGKMCCKSGCVFKQRTTVDAMTMRFDITETT